VADARRSVQNILSPNRVQEYLKCLRDMAIMKGLKRVLEKSFKYSESQLSKAGFFTSGVKIKSKSLKSQRQTSVVEQEQTKKPPIWEAFLCLNLNSH
jgi:hypothetical protein